MSVNHDRFAAEDVRQLVGDRKMRGGPAPPITPHPATPSVRRRSLRSTGSIHVGAGGECGRVNRRGGALRRGHREETGSRRLLPPRRQRCVGMQRDAAAPGNVGTRVERGRRYFCLRASQEIDGGDRFDFLKSFRKDCENGWHDMI